MHNIKYKKQINNNIGNDVDNNNNDNNNNKILIKNHLFNFFNVKYNYMNITKQPIDCIGCNYIYVILLLNINLYISKKLCKTLIDFEFLNYIYNNKYIIENLSMIYNSECVCCATQKVTDHHCDNIKCMHCGVVFVNKNDTKLCSLCNFFNIDIEEDGQLNIINIHLISYRNRKSISNIFDSTHMLNIYSFCNTYMILLLLLVVLLIGITFVLFK